MLWTRRRSPPWSAYLPIFVPGSPSKAWLGGAGLRRPSWLLGAVFLTVVVAGAFMIEHRRDAADRAAAVWTALDLRLRAPDDGRAEEPAQATDAPDRRPALVQRASPETPASAPVARATGTAATLPAGDPGPAVPMPAASGGNARAQAVDDGTPAIEWQHLYRLGHEFQGKGDLEAAAEMFRLAARLNPAHGALLYDWGYLLQTQGKEQAAMEKYREAVKLDPTHPYAHYNLGYLLQRRGDNEAALTEYRNAAASHPDNPFLQYNWGVVLERVGEVEEAVQRYRRATELAPEGQPGKDAHQRLVALGIED